MLQRCKEKGRNFEYLSLFDDEPGSWNPCLGGSEDDARSRLENALKLGKTGSDADHYKTKERAALASAFALAKDIDSIAEYFQKNLPDSTTASELKIWTKYRTICPKGEGTFSVEKALRNNSVVYVKGSLSDNVRLAAFTMLMSEIGQVTSRLQSQGIEKKHAFAFWDEVSFYVDPEIPRALAAIRSSGLTFGLAYQSQTDTKNLRDRTVNGEYVFNGVNVNCQLKLVYGGWDQATASWLSNLCGTVRKNAVTRAELKSNDAAAQTWTDKVSVSSVEEPFLPANLINMMPQRVCVFIMPGKLPQICFTAYVNIKNRDMIKLDASNEFADNTLPEKLPGKSIEPQQQNGLRVAPAITL